MIKVEKIVRNNNKLTVLLSEHDIFNLRDIPIQLCFFEKGEESFAKEFYINPSTAKVVSAHFILKEEDFNRITGIK